MSRGQVLIVVDRSTGAVRSLPIRLWMFVGAAALMSLPVLIGLGAKLSARAELDRLKARRTTLEAQNESYRSATEALTNQVRSLAGVVDELPIGSSAPRAPGMPLPTPEVEHVVSVPPESALVSAALLTSLSSPDDLYDVLRGVLAVLENRLPTIERTVERRELLAAAAPSIWPTEGWLTAAFGVRSDPLTGEQGFHQGIDISTAEGRPVYTTAEGVVETASYSGDYGNLVVVQHGFGLSTRYGHLSRFAVGVGSAVKRGDVIGYVGATGRATGAHVHYEVLANGAPIDPLRFLTAATRPADRRN